MQSCFRPAKKPALSQSPHPSSGALPRHPRAAQSTNHPHIQTQSDPCSVLDAGRCGASWPRVRRPVQQTLQLQSEKQQDKPAKAGGMHASGPSGKLLQDSQHLTAHAHACLVRNIANANPTAVALATLPVAAASQSARTIRTTHPQLHGACFINLLSVRARLSVVPKRDGKATVF